MMILVFEDEQVRELYPVTLGKPAFAISCGSWRLIDQLTGLGHPLRALVRPHLVELVQADFPGVARFSPSDAGPLLLVNARLVPSLANLDRLRELIQAARPSTLFSAGRAAAAWVSAEAVRALDSASRGSACELLKALRLAPNSAGAEDAPVPANPGAAAELFEYPHDIVRHHMAILASNLEARIAGGEYQPREDGVFAAAGATLGPYGVVDASRGPIVLEAGAAVGPYCLLSGPVHLGPGVRVLEHAAIKDGVAVGHTAKIGGEVEASIIEPFTNKQHHGFLGHSYLGSWINLGAGTCNSDLKNTYGQVNMEYHGRRVKTGMQFIGAIVGDYAKTAINTGIFTGKTIGACSMVYGFVTTNVPSFVNYARLFGQVTEAPVEIMVSTQRRMFSRRGVSQRPLDIQLLHDMYDLTAHERELSGEPLSLEPLSL